MKELETIIGRCYINGMYHYRSHEKDKKAYCCLSDNSCPFYRSVRNRGYCVKEDKAIKR